MGLREVGTAHISRSGKALHIEYEPLSSTFIHHLFISLENLKLVIEKKVSAAKVVMPVHESRENV